MFNSQEQRAVENYPTLQTETSLAVINNQLQKLNAEYLDIMYSMEDKLHSILNLRSPDKMNDTKPPEKSINDFVGAANEQLQTYRNQNGRLQKALDHLRSII